MAERNVYRKHQSFVGLHQKSPLANVLPRIQRVRDGLPSMQESEDRKAILKKACDEILENATTIQDHAPFTLHPNSIEEIHRLSDAELPRYLFYRYRYEMFPDRKLLDAHPPLLQIEPTSVCNYRCVFCYQTDTALTSKDSVERGMMSLDLFKQIIDQAEGHCEGITLASRGEPTASPHIKEMMAYLRGKFLATKLNTNASLLDEAKCHAILEADLQTLVFSADAASEPTYSQFRVGGHLDTVLRNIRRFHDIRIKQYPQSRLITRVSGVKVPGTPDLDAMEKFWGELVDQVAFVSYNPWENSYESPVNDVTDACSDLWRRMFIWWDGRVNPCDVDYLSRLAVGRFPEKSLAELWRSPSYEELRRKHLTKARAQCYPCNRCTVV